MNQFIYFDNRWIGSHGIGRFSEMLGKHIKMINLNLPGRPTAILDPLIFAIKVFFLPVNSVIFTPGFNAPLFIRQKFILTLHDLNHIDRNENTSFLKKIYYNFIIKRAIKFSYKILTVSEFTKARIVSWSNINPDKIIVVSNGVDGIYNVNANKFSPGYQYFLCVSNRKRHKNEFRLIEAFSTAKIPSHIYLLFTGNETLTILKHCESLGVSNRVKFLGFVDEANMPGLYTGSLGLLFPSLYEGFGLPVIEAMACGIPVLTSNTSSLPEIASNAALLVNPISIDEIGSGIELLANDSIFRNKLSDLGLSRAKNFSWRNVAIQVESVLRESCEA